MKCVCSNLLCYSILYADLCWNHHYYQLYLFLNSSIFEKHIRRNFRHCFFKNFDGEIKDDISRVKIVSKYTISATVHLNYGRAKSVSVYSAQLSMTVWVSVGKRAHVRYWGCNAVCWPWKDAQPAVASLTVQSQCTLCPVALGN